MDKNDDIQGKIDLTRFEEIFRMYFSQLCAYAIKYTKDLDSAKEIVHVVFINVWEKRESIRPDQNIRSYLYTSVYNRCLNHLRNSKKTVDLDSSIETIHGQDTTGDLETQELQAKIDAGILTLPDRCREIFILSRYEELKYAAIAEKLGISIKTVEAQMSKALKLLREYLSEFLSIILFIFLK